MLALVFPTCHIPYGWLNQLKSLEATFTKVCTLFILLVNFIFLCFIVRYFLSAPQKQNKAKQEKNRENAWQEV